MFCHTLRLVTGEMLKCLPIKTSLASFENQGTPSPVCNSSTNLSGSICTGGGHACPVINTTTKSNWTRKDLFHLTDYSSLKGSQGRNSDTAGSIIVCLTSECFAMLLLFSRDM